MFGRKKMYKKGLADAMQAYEAFGRKQEAALEHMREEIRKGNQQLEAAISDLGEDLNGIYDHLTSKEKAALYHLSTPMDIKDLEDEEKRLLLAVLYQLSFDEGDGVTDAQRDYIRSIQKYLEVTNPQTEAELSAVGDIDSLETQKAFLQVVLEFLYLQDSDELSDEQEDFLGYFSVNRKQAALIEERVSRLFNAVGNRGIAEKYGYVAEEEQEDAIEQKGIEENNAGFPKNIISEELADDFVKTYTYGTGYCIETENYLITNTHESLCRIDKRTGNGIRVKLNDSLRDLGHFPFYKMIYEPKGGNSAVVVGDIIYYVSRQRNNEIFSFDVDAWQEPKKIIKSSCRGISICGSQMAYIINQDNIRTTSIGLYDFSSGKQRIIAMDIENADTIYAVPDGVFFAYRKFYMKSALSFYSYKEKRMKSLVDPCEFGNYMTIDKILFADTENIYISVNSRSRRIWESRPIKVYMIPHGTLNGESKIDFSQYECIDTLTIGETLLKEEVCAYPDLLLYVAQDGTIKSRNYRTGETMEIAENGIYRDGEERPASLMRIGKWVYYEGRLFKYVHKVSFDAPGEVEIVELGEPWSEERAERIEKIPVLNLKP